MKDHKTLRNSLDFGKYCLSLLTTVTRVGGELHLILYRSPRTSLAQTLGPGLGVSLALSALPQSQATTSLCVQTVCKAASVSVIMCNCGDKVRTKCFTWYSAYTAWALTVHLLSTLCGYVFETSTLWHSRNGLMPLEVTVLQPASSTSAKPVQSEAPVAPCGFTNSWNK